MRSQLGPGEPGWPTTAAPASSAPRPATFVAFSRAAAPLTPADRGRHRPAAEAPRHRRRHPHGTAEPASRHQPRTLVRPRAPTPHPSEPARLRQHRPRRPTHRATVASRGRSQLCGLAWETSLVGSAAGAPTSYAAGQKAIPRPSTSSSPARVIRHAWSHICASARRSHGWAVLKESRQTTDEQGAARVRCSGSVLEQMHDVARAGRLSTS